LPRASRSSFSRARTRGKMARNSASPSTMPGTVKMLGSATRLRSPTLVSAAAWSWPTAILRTMSASLPCVPPA